MSQIALNLFSLSSPLCISFTQALTHRLLTFPFTQLAKTAVSSALATFKSLDGLVLNHGTLDPVKRIADTTPSEWREAFNVNFFSCIAFVSYYYFSFILICHYPSLEPMLDLSTSHKSTRSFSQLVFYILHLRPFSFSLSLSYTHTHTLVSKLPSS